MIHRLAIVVSLLLVAPIGALARPTATVQWMNNEDNQNCEMPQDGMMLVIQDEAFAQLAHL